jgi:hypothetical protein
VTIASCLTTCTKAFYITLQPMKEWGRQRVQFFGMTSRCSLPWYSGNDSNFYE